MRRLLLCLAFCAAACGDTPGPSLEGDTGTGETGAEAEAETESETAGGMCSLEPEALTCGLWGCGETQLCGGTAEFAVCYDPPCEFGDREVCAFEAMRDGTPGLLVFAGLGGDGDESVYGVSLRGERAAVRQTLSSFDLQLTEQPAQSCTLASSQYFADCLTGVNSYDECAFGSWTQGCEGVDEVCG